MSGAVGPDRIALALYACRPPGRCYERHAQWMQIREALIALYTERCGDFSSERFRALAQTGRRTS